MRKSLAVALVTIVAFAVLYGCASYSPAHNARTSREMSPPVAPQREVSAGAPVKLAADAPAPANEANARLVVYNATLNLVVDSLSGALDQARGIAAQLGGHLQEMGSDYVVVKVPAAKFEEALAAMGKIGEVTKREIKGSDVTEEMRDLRIRLANAENMRERLTQLLNKGDKVEDALKVEKELERVTETIELLKGKIQYLENSVAFSTITVKCNSPLPQEQVAQAMPFMWVQGLGADMARGGMAYPDVPAWRDCVKFMLPEGFIKFYERDYVTRAMSADGVMLLLQRHENYQNGTLDFWPALIRRALTEQKSIAVKGDEAMALANGTPAQLLTGSKQIGNQKYGYLVAVVVGKNSFLGKRHVYTFEAWGPEAAFAAQQEKIVEAIKTLEIAK
jgi:hypothetical protein